MRARRRAHVLSTSSSNRHRAIIEPLCALDTLIRVRESMRDAVVSESVAQDHARALARLANEAHAIIGAGGPVWETLAIGLRTLLAAPFVRILRDHAFHVDMRDSGHVELLADSGRDAGRHRGLIVHPLYDVVADACSMRPGEVVTVMSSDVVLSASQTDRSSPGFVVAVVRGPTDAPFSCEERNAVDLFHHHVLPFARVRVTQSAGLTPRARATLERLLRGESDKEIAQYMGISRHTVHQYCKLIYRAYGVSSRMQLIARATAAPSSRASSTR